MLAYHGTGRYFSEFDKNEISSNHDFQNEGFFFITDLVEATWYANDNKYNTGDWSPHIITAELTFENPLIVTADSDAIYSNPTNFFDNNSDRLYSLAYNDEYDGIIVNGTEEYDGTQLLVVFEPDQINIMEVTSL